MGTAERPPSSRLQTHEKKPLTYLFQTRKRAINTNGIINKMISWGQLEMRYVRAHMASFVPAPSSAAAVSRPFACSLELPNFRVRIV